MPIGSEALLLDATLLFAETMRTGLFATQPTPPMLGRRFCKRFFAAVKGSFLMRRPRRAARRISCCCTYEHSVLGLPQAHLRFDMNALYGLNRHSTGVGYDS